MKKILLTITISIAIGTVFAFVIFKNINNDVQLVLNEDNIVTFFQVGVFKNNENAQNFMQNYNSSIIIKDKEYYRVIIAILMNDEAIAKEKAFFDSLGIEYYLKKESISDKEFINKLQEYEHLLISASDETYNTVNKNILKLYESRQK